MAAIRAERVVVRLHCDRIAGGDRLLSQREVTCAPDEVFHEEVVGALFEQPELDHQLVEAQARRLIDSGRSVLSPPLRGGRFGERGPSRHLADLLRAQYLFAIMSSSAGKSVITSCPVAVTTSSSSIRAAERPPSAGQYVSSAKTIPSLISTGSFKEFKRLMMGRSCSPTPRPCPNCRAKASISLSKPNSSAFGQTFAISSVVTPGLN